jgi:carboxypeptidase C (cathepsin A)
MANYSNFNALEINLENSSSGEMTVSNQGATYEEAFLGGGSEEMSNARGKGRARRKKRKLERIANKREVRTERRKLKGDRQEERIARRKTRKEKRQEIAKKISRYTGIGVKEVLEQSLSIPFDYFWKELLRDQGKTIGRLDSRYIGMDKKDAGQRPDYNSELTSWEHSFTPAINMYLRDEFI